MHHLVIYRNVAGPGKRIAGNAVGGVIGAAVGSALGNEGVDVGETSVERTAFESHSDEEWRRALYTRQENPRSELCFIVYIDTEFLGRRSFTRSVFSARMDDINRAVPLAVDAAIKQHLDSRSSDVK